MASPTGKLLGECFKRHKIVFRQLRFKEHQHERSDLNTNRSGAPRDDSLRKARRKNLGETFPSHAGNSKSGRGTDGFR